MVCVYAFVLNIGAVCGLFGDFKGYDMQTCDGSGTVEYGGWKNAWDNRAWTWERSYVEENCPPAKITTTAVPGVTGVAAAPYLPLPDPTFAYDACEDLSSDERVESTKQCQAAMDEDGIDECCDNIGGEFCDNLVDDCALDACENAKIDGIELLDAVKQLLSDPILRECNNLTFVDDNYKIYATETPTASPTIEPTEGDGSAPPPHRNNEPIQWPTVAPTTMQPTRSPSEHPTLSPTFSPTPAPTAFPTKTPTKAPTPAPTDGPTRGPIAHPTRAPTPAPTPLPSRAPTERPTTRPPSSAPTNSPSPPPTPGPTESPTPSPTNHPSISPTSLPSKVPSNDPTTMPTLMPSVMPTFAPTRPSNCCKDQETETQCVSHTGTSCVWLVSNSPLAIKYNTRCLSQAFVKKKITSAGSSGSSGGGSSGHGKNKHKSKGTESGSNGSPSSGPAPSPGSPSSGGTSSGGSGYGSGSGSSNGDSSSNHGSSSVNSCHPVEQMMPFMLPDADDAIVEEAHFYRLTSEAEIVGILSVATAFIICCYSLCRCRDRRKDSYDVINDPTVYSVI